MIFGAIRTGDILKISISADRKWDGKLLCDTPRHQTVMNMPLDWPRINQFPEWFTVEQNKRYMVHDLTSNTRKSYTP